MTLLSKAKKVEGLSDWSCRLSALITSHLVLAGLTLSAGEAAACRMYLPASLHLANYLSQPYELVVLAPLEDAPLTAATGSLI